MSERRSFLSGLSTFQLLAGALAAMTSAWVASFLGVAGTLIGAALGSLVLSVSSALYANTLDKGRTLVVQTADGNVVRTEADPGETAEALAEVEEETGSTVRSAEVVDDAGRSGPPWKRIAVSTVAVFVLAVGAMGAYELATGQSYGGSSDNSRIFGGGGGNGGSGEGQQQDQQDQQDGDSDTDPGTDDTDPTSPEEQAPEDDAEPTPAPTTTQAPTPTPTPAPTRTPAPTAPAE